MWELFKSKTNYVRRYSYFSKLVTLSFCSNWHKPLSHSVWIKFYKATTLGVAPNLPGFLKYRPKYEEINENFTSVMSYPQRPCPHSPLYRMRLVAMQQIHQHDLSIVNSRTMRSIQVEHISTQFSKKWIYCISNSSERSIIMCAPILFKNCTYLFLSWKFQTCILLFRH